MSEQYQYSPSSWLAIQALEERIEVEAPWLQVLAVHVFPYPFLKVRDSVHGIVVGFSSEADYLTYVEIVHRLPERSLDHAETAQIPEREQPLPRLRPRLDDYHRR